MKLTKTKQIILFSLLVLICLGWFPHVFSLTKLAQSQVAIVQSVKATAEEIDYPEIKSLVSAAVNRVGGFAGVIRDGDTVVIKPNLVIKETADGPLPPGANGITTDWRVTKAIVELVREINNTGKVYVMEGSAYPTAAVMTALNYTPEYIPGVDEFIAIETDSGDWLDYASPGLVNVELPGGLLHTSYYLNRKYKEADVLISVPALKNHNSSCISGSIKNVGIGGSPANIYGNSASDPLRLKGISHFASGELHNWIHDFYLCKPVDFVVYDGIRGFQNGPGMISTLNYTDNQMNMRLIMASRDAVAADTIAALTIGWDPTSVAHLTALNNSSAGNIDPSCITVLGKRVDEVRKNFAGSRPYLGGAQITDTTAPTLAITSSSVSGSTLNLALNASSDTVKAEVLIDGILLEPVVTANYTAVAYTLGGLAAGLHQGVVHTYDKVLNHAEAAFSFTIGSVLTGTPRPSAGTSSPTQSITVLLGDVNGNGSVNIVDALMTAQYYVGLDPSPFNALAADVNKDNAVTIIDALMIAQYYVGLIGSF